ncbi:hypothetical protein BC829DRAFT_442712 [Chytridium lagenaria]|nr:hypothetical protein BC829DRAFT_442712 [Chytridium lagenaria]
MEVRMGGVGGGSAEAEAGDSPPNGYSVGRVAAAGRSPDVNSVDWSHFYTLFGIKTNHPIQPRLSCLAWIFKYQEPPQQYKTPPPLLTNRDTFHRMDLGASASASSVASLLASSRTYGRGGAAEGGFGLGRTGGEALESGSGFSLGRFRAGSGDGTDGLPGAVKAKR